MEEPIFWHQGLFLKPHHFQLNDRYYHSLFEPYHQNLQPHLWGVGNLQIDKTALLNQSFSIENGEFWFSDMTYAVLNDNSIVQPRMIDKSMMEEGKCVKVFIGLKRLNYNHPNVTSVMPGDEVDTVNTRYLANTKSKDVNDLYEGSTTAQIKKITYMLKIFFEDEIKVLDNYDLIPIAMLELDFDEIKISEQFIPPSFKLSASHILLRIVKDVINQLSSRSRELEVHKINRGIHNAEFGSRDMIYLLCLRSLNRYIPLLNHMVEGQVHPWDLFGTFRQIIGELSTFSEHINLIEKSSNDDFCLDDYDHYNLYKTFFKVSKLVTKLLDDITAGPRYILPIEYDGTYYSTLLDPNAFSGNNRYYLVLSTEQSHDTVAESFILSAKCGSQKIMPTLIDQSLPGVNFERLQIPPPELPRRSKSVYFQLDHHNEHWIDIKREKHIAIHWIAAPEDIEIELMIAGR